MLHHLRDRREDNSSQGRRASHGISLRTDVRLFHAHPGLCDSEPSSQRGGRSVRASAAAAAEQRLLGVQNDGAEGLDGKRQLPGSVSNGLLRSGECGAVLLRWGFADAGGLYGGTDVASQPGMKPTTGSLGFLTIRTSAIRRFCVLF